MLLSIFFLILLIDRVTTDSLSCLFSWNSGWRCKWDGRPEQHEPCIGLDHTLSQCYGSVPKWSVKCMILSSESVRTTVKILNTETNNCLPIMISAAFFWSIKYNSVRSNDNLRILSSYMAARRRAKRKRLLQHSRLIRSNKPRCIVCEEQFDSPTLSVHFGKGRAHLLCAGLARIGLKGLARSSGRW